MCPSATNAMVGVYHPRAREGWPAVDTELPDQATEPVIDAAGLEQMS
jgi:hypothetical protein